MTVTHYIKKESDKFDSKLLFRNRTTNLKISLHIFRHDADVAMEGQFLVRQIYDDEITYNLIGAAVQVLSK